MLSIFTAAGVQKLEVFKDKLIVLRTAYETNPENAKVCAQITAVASIAHNLAKRNDADWIRQWQAELKAQITIIDNGQGTGIPTLDGSELSYQLACELYAFCTNLNLEKDMNALARGSIELISNGNLDLYLKNMQAGLNLQILQYKTKQKTAAALANASNMAIKFDTEINQKLVEGLIRKWKLSPEEERVSAFIDFQAAYSQQTKELIDETFKNSITYFRYTDDGDIARSSSTANIISASLDTEKRIEEYLIKEGIIKKHGSLNILHQHIKDLIETRERESNSENSALTELNMIIESLHISLNNYKQGIHLQPHSTAGKLLSIIKTKPEPDAIRVQWLEELLARWRTIENNIKIKSTDRTIANNFKDAYYEMAQQLKEMQRNNITTPAKQADRTQVELILRCLQVNLQSAGLNLKLEHDLEIRNDIEERIGSITVPRRMEFK
jgi:hypothetical protein